MSKRSRRRARDQPRPQPQARRQAPSQPAGLAKPEQLLLDQIAAGALDPHLTQVAEAIRARYELLQTIGSAKALALLNVGDRVRINHHASPRYLRGVQGTVVELDEHSATICVHRPVGRFKSGEIRCRHSRSTGSTQPPESHPKSRRSRHQPSPTTRPELDDLIAEVTVDCYDEDEQLTAFENAFYDARLQCRGTVIGEEVKVLSVAISNGRRELIATCERAGRRHEVALLDIDLHADPPPHA